MFVATNVENYQITHFIGSWEGGTQFGEAGKVTFPHSFEPSDERNFTIWVLLPKLAQLLS